MKLSKNLQVAGVALILLFPVSCRSSDKRDDPSQVQSGEGEVAPATTAKVATDECKTKPEPVFCCEAMTPSCNDCRDQAKKAQSAWAKKCLKPAKEPNDCASPPIAACCSDATDGCRQCREAAVTTLIDWKERCAAVEAFPCDKAPPVVECCPSAIPSCNGCRSRNQRLQEDWGRRCK